MAESSVVSRPALTVVVAVELWADGTVPVYAPMARAWPVAAAVDTHSASWARYGVTTGVWHLLDLLGELGLPATFGISGAVSEQCPDVVDAVAAAGHEIAAHAWSQEVVLSTLPVERVRVEIARCTAVFEAATGVRPTGWMSPRASSPTGMAKLLTEQGYTWCGDDADRDTPRVQDTPQGRIVRMAHSDLSDVRDGADPRTYLALHEMLVDELTTAPSSAVGTIALHAHVGARPLLRSSVARLLAHVAERRDALRIVTRGDVARTVLAAEVAA